MWVARGPAPVITKKLNTSETLGLQLFPGFNWIIIRALVMRTSWWLILIFIPVLTSSECSPAFVRIPAVTLATANSSGFNTKNTSLLSCLDRCKNSSCIAIAFDHSTGHCNSFGDDARGLKDNLHPKFASDVFHKICIKTDYPHDCSLLWHFDLNVTHLTSFRNINISSYEDCIERCSLNDNNCKSGSYNSKLNQCITRNSTDDSNSDPLTQEPDWIKFFNLCAIDHQLECNNKPKINSNTTLRSSIRVIKVESFSQCQQLCQKEESFHCISYSFNTKSHLCNLSSDALFNILSTPLIEETIFGQCTTTPQVKETISPRISRKKSRTALKTCHDTISSYNSYEKVSGYRLTEEYVGRSSSPLYSNESRGITEECLRLCSGEKCLALSLNYVKSQCSVVVPEEVPTHKALSFSYFKRLCISETIIGSCNKLWLIDRIPQVHLNVEPYSVIEEISKESCIKQCLKESNRCRSANYHIEHKECSLSEDDRHNNPDAFVPRQGTEYLENQCRDNGLAISPRQFSTFCTYGQPIHDKYLEFVDKTVAAGTEAECRQACDSELLFNCRSYSFIPRQQPSTNQCFLSSDTTSSPGAQLRDAPGAVYVERTCTQNFNPQTQTPPINQPPPFPSPPPNPMIPGLPSPPQIIMPNPPPPPGPQYPGVSTGCFYPTDFTFEKTMGMVPRPDAFAARSSNLPLVGPQSIAPDCTRGCLEGDMHCISFVLQYPVMGSPACITFNRGVAFDRNVLVPKQDSAYFEKICLHKRRCNRLWTFERVVGFEIDGSDTKTLHFVPSKETCEDQCLLETSFECRSAEYVYSMGICKLSTETRRSRPEAFRYVGPDVDYLENQCASDPVQCEYTEFPAKFLPFADRFVSAMATLQECQQKCEKERDFLCRSVTWNHVTTDCLLSSDDRYSTPMGINVLVDRPDWVYSEKGNCGQVRVDCTPNNMLVRVIFGSPFNGRVYAKGNPQACTQQGGNQLQVALPVSLGVLCGTVQEGIYTNEIVVQQHPLIMTDNDKVYRVVCSFAVVDQVVTMDSGGRWDRPPGLDVINVKGGAPQQVIQNSAPPPAVRLRITGRNGQDVATVGIGDELYFRIEPEPNSAFGIFATNLIAKSEFGDQLILLDNKGCPTDLNIFPPLMPEPNSRALAAPFHAFRFPATGRINFEVHITFCQEMCPPAQCSAKDVPYGRKKRSNENSPSITSKIQNATFDMNPYNPSSTNSNITYIPANYTLNWQIESLPTKIPLPSSPAVVSVPNNDHLQEKGPIEPRTNTEILNQVPLRLSLVVNNQEDDKLPRRGDTAPQYPVPPKPAIMRRYEGPIIRDPAFPLDKVCTDKSTIVAAVLATIVTQLILMGAGVGIYVYYRRKRRYDRHRAQLHTPHNLLYETTTTNVLRPLGMRDKLPPQHATLKVSNWIEQQQKRNRDPNKINIMEMSA
uniref:ZP domain-containing protein n=1 Tax=Strigamia maritima TaxID=126957 RepID=T1IZB1_STRMM